MNDATCFSRLYSDTDQDGLIDRCENDLAFYFAPELAYTAADRTGREPKWVARPIGDAGARIMYVLSYYTDDGPTTTWCNENVAGLFSTEACAGHFGDSESITLDVYYNEQTKHWVLDNAYYSAHTGYNTYARGTAPYPAMTYPDRVGGYPRAYVSYQKHANYATEDECDRSSMFGSIETDTCFPNTYERVNAGGQLNPGSRYHHTAAQDCMLASNPIYQETGRTECYWTYKRFSGWTNGQPDASAYQQRMSDFLFF